jgi:hypothetical protein
MLFRYQIFRCKSSENQNQMGKPVPILNWHMDTLMVSFWMRNILFCVWTICIEYVFGWFGRGRHLDVVVSLISISTWYAIQLSFNSTTRINSTCGHGTQSGTLMWYSMVTPVWIVCDVTSDISILWFTICCIQFVVFCGSLCDILVVIVCGVMSDMNILWNGILW